MEEKFRISDIFKRSKEDKHSPSQGIRFSQAELKETEKQSSDKIDFSSVISSAISKGSGKKGTVIDSALYADAVLLARQIYKDQSDTSNITTSVYSVVERMIDSINKGNGELLESALADYLQPKDYLYYHVVNVCIISLHLGKGLGYEFVCLLELGVAAFVHDIGISRYLDIISQPKRLNPQEYSELKQHPLVGSQLLEQIDNNLNPSIFEVVLQEHERIDGSGYPKGLKNDEITEYAQIVGLSDVYEAIIHRRPYRDKCTPLEAIKIILDNKNTFVHKVVKILIEKIGIFPIGTFVQLNSKEIAQVIQENPELPLRPIVNIIIDSSGKRLIHSRQIDLSDSPAIYISGISSS